MTRTTVVELCLLIAIAIAFGFSWLAWHTGRRWGPRALTPTWLAVALGYGACSSWFTAGPGGRGSVEYLMARSPWIVPLFFSVGLFGFGLEALSVRKSLRDINARFNARIGLRAVGGFFGGLGVLLVAALAWDRFAVVRA